MGDGGSQGNFNADVRPLPFGVHRHGLKGFFQGQIAHPKKGLYRPYKIDTFDTFGRPGHSHPFRKFHTEREWAILLWVNRKKTYSQTGFSLWKKEPETEQ